MTRWTRRLPGLAAVLAALCASALEGDPPGRYRPPGSVEVQREMPPEGPLFRVQGQAEYPDGTLLIAVFRETHTEDALDWFRVPVAAGRFQFDCGPVRSRMLAGEYGFDVRFALEYQPVETQMRLRGAGYPASYQEPVASANFVYGTREAWVAQEREAIQATRAVIEKVRAVAAEMDALWDGLVGEGTTPAAGASARWETNGGAAVQEAYQDVDGAVLASREFVHYRHTDWLKELDSFAASLEAHYRSTLTLLRILEQGSTASAPEREEAPVLLRDRRRGAIELVQFLRRMETHLSEQEGRLDRGEVDFKGEGQG